MKPIKQSGVALVVTLIMLSLVTFLTVAFLSVARRERSSILVTQSQTDAKNAAALREQFAAQGGWRGGEGVQPDRTSGGSGGGNRVPPTQPRKPGVPSGGGGGGIDED